MAKDDVTAEVNGLQLSNSTFSASPPGSLRRADECVMPQKGVVQPRTGQARLALMPTATGFAWALTQFDGKLLVNFSPSKNTAAGYGLGKAGVAAYSGTYAPVDTTTDGDAAGRMKFAQANEYLHFCAESGPKVLEAEDSTPRASGLLRMPDPGALMASAAGLVGTDGVGLEYGFSRAYRTVLRKPTSNGTSLLSPPSGRVVIQNRILAPIGSMERAANVVTVTLPGTEDPGLDVADTFTIDPGEANFPAAAETVASVTDNVVTYADVAGDAVNTVAQDLDTGPRPVLVIAWLPPDATTATPVRIYRSLDVDGTDPDDEMFLVDEVYPDGTDITNGFLVYGDVTPESVIDDPLYTNPLTGEGAAAANLQAPIYRDVANWGDATFYANTTGLQQLRAQMLGVGPDDGVQDGDTIDIDGVTLTFKDTPAAATDVQIVSNGAYSFNVSRTTQNLIQTANVALDAAASGIRLYGESTATGKPGKFLISATDYAEAVFVVTLSRTESWVTPNATTVPPSSQAQREPHFLSYSKPDRPESVPALNFLPVGSKSYPIRRILGLQQALLVFKDGEGIWTVSGSAPYTVAQISTANIIAQDAACVFSDATWAYTDQGIVRVSDAGGVTVVSRPIETELNAQRRSLPEETANYAFAVPYEVERRILFFVPFDAVTDIGDTTVDLVVLKAWCYNEATQAWTGPLYTNVTSGVVTRGLSDDDDQMLLALGIFDVTWNTTRITIEQTAALGPTGADAVFSVTITDVDDGPPTVITLADMTDVEADDALLQVATLSPAALRFSVIKALRPDIGPNAVELYEDGDTGTGFDWATGAAFIAKHFDVTLQFQPQGNPTARKTLTRVSWLFKPNEYVSPNAETIISTDQTQADMAIASPSVGFGLNPFGSVPFGDPSPLVLDVNPPDPKATNAAQFFVGLRVPICLSKLKLEGFSLRLETATAPVGRGK